MLKNVDHFKSSLFSDIFFAIFNLKYAVLNSPMKVKDNKY